MNKLRELNEQLQELNPQTRRNLLIAVAVILLLIVIYSLMQQQLKTLSARKAGREQTLTELMLLKQRYHEANSGSQRLINRMATVTGNDSPAVLVEQTELVPPGNLQSKPLPRVEQGQYVEEGAELIISGIGLNEAVNLLYRLEQGNKPLIIKKGSIRARFNEPALLDITLQAALLRPTSQADTE